MRVSEPLRYSGRVAVLMADSTTGKPIVDKVYSVEYISGNDNPDPNTVARKCLKIAAASLVPMKHN